VEVDQGSSWIVDIQLAVFTLEKDLKPNPGSHVTVRIKAVRSGLAAAISAFTEVKYTGSETWLGCSSFLSDNPF
jgi:hypothetical protein